LIWKKELTGPILIVGWGGDSPIGHIMLMGIFDATINIAE
jgi:hypothetical protein